MDLFCLFVNLLELLQFDSAIDALSTGRVHSLLYLYFALLILLAFSSKIMSFIDVFQARNTFGLKENDVNHLEIDVAWGIERNQTCMIYLLGYSFANLNFST
jgi:hypothetical protein